MNIFYLDNDPVQAARWMVDRHVVKMILETAQLLSTAHRLLDGEPYEDRSSGRKVTRWRLPDARDAALYSATHANHPCAVWCRMTVSNYEWTFTHLKALLVEYRYRYGKSHKVEESGMWKHFIDPPVSMTIRPFTLPATAMPDEYRVPGDPVASYRAYYTKAKAHLHRWTNRAPPLWAMAA